MSTLSPFYSKPLMNEGSVSESVIKMSIYSSRITFEKVTFPSFLEFANIIDSLQFPIILFFTCASSALYSVRDTSRSILPTSMYDLSTLNSLILFSDIGSIMDISPTLTMLPVTISLITEFPASYIACSRLGVITVRFLRFFRN
jgi:hypothetical protein